jgi:hypothetical protein
VIPYDLSPVVKAFAGDSHATISHSFTLRFRPPLRARRPARGVRKHARHVKAARRRG